MVSHYLVSSFYQSAYSWQRCSFKDATCGGYSCHNQPLCSPGSMYCDLETPIVTKVLDSHLSPHIGSCCLIPTSFLSPDFTPYSSRQSPSLSSASNYRPSSVYRRITSSWRVYQFFYLQVCTSTALFPALLTKCDDNPIVVVVALYPLCCSEYDTNSSGKFILFNILPCMGFFIVFLFPFYFFSSG